MASLWGRGGRGALHAVGHGRTRVNGQGGIVRTVADWHGGALMRVRGMTCAAKLAKQTRFCGAQMPMPSNCVTDTGTRKDTDTQPQKRVVTLDSRAGQSFLYEAPVASMLVAGAQPSLDLAPEAFCRLSRCGDCSAPRKLAVPGE
jgi:hypothetical protein